MLGPWKAHISIKLNMVVIQIWNYWCLKIKPYLTAKSYFDMMANDFVGSQKFLIDMSHSSSYISLNKMGISWTYLHLSHLYLSVYLKRVWNALYQIQIKNGPATKKHFWIFWFLMQYNRILYPIYTKIK